MGTWPHAPSKRVDVPGRYIVTSATNGKRLLFRNPEEPDYLQDQLFLAAQEFEFELQAWAVFANHYHFIGFTAKDGVRKITTALHGRTSRHLNQLHDAAGRTVWYRTWDSLITYEKSYMARLHYVHENAVRRRLARRAKDYRWCSAKWFEDGAE